jgi:hypothetical protein
MYASILEIAIIGWKDINRQFSIMLRNFKIKKSKKLARNSTI